MKNKNEGAGVNKHGPSIKMINFTGSRRTYDPQRRIIGAKSYFSNNNNSCS